MSRDNVEVVRRFYAAVNTWLDSYWADPDRSLDETPGVDDVFDRMEPEAEWDWLFSPDVFQGRDELLRAAGDWIETVSEWRIEVEELIDGTEDRVLVIVRVIARGRGSGAPVAQPGFAAVTVRDGKVACIKDNTHPAEGFEAAGLVP
jgi:hypothetical protein